MHYSVLRCTVLKTPSDQTGLNVLAVVWPVCTHIPEIQTMKFVHKYF